MPVFSILADFLNLFHPALCPVCSAVLARSEDPLCIECRLGLSELDYRSAYANPLHHHFEGRLELSCAIAFLRYAKGTRVQRLLHAIKYEGRSDLARELGRIYGRQLMQEGFVFSDSILDFSKIDALVPVPMHASKQRKRGFNQATEFALGLATELGIEVTEYLERPLKGSSQTLKDRYERWENASSTYRVRKSANCEGKHFLLIDDVVTTGATLEACGLRLHEAGAASVGLICLACAPVAS